MATFPNDDLAYKMMRSYCEGAQNLPLAVQVVGRPYMDEQVLKILTVLEEMKDS
jgi:Asp-tRNA(Asn)/Glu-tRNA(Gln) amidotransferase A subunit family amidase